MNRLLLLAILAVSLFSFASNPVRRDEPQPGDNPTNVLVCQSSGAYAYHNQQCRGLKNCRATILNVSMAKAQFMGFSKACGYCFPKKQADRKPID